MTPGAWPNRRAKRREPNEVPKLQCDQSRGNALQSRHQIRAEQEARFGDRRGGDETGRDENKRQVSLAKYSASHKCREKRNSNVSVRHQYTISPGAGLLCEFI